MATEKQIEANRANSLLSTGPKCTVLTRFNGIKYGLFAKSKIIPGEDVGEFQNLVEGLKKKFSPAGVLQEEIVDQIIFLLWRLRRARQSENVILIKYTNLNNEIQWDGVLELDYLEKIAKYEKHALKQIVKLLELLEKVQQQEYDS